MAQEIVLLCDKLRSKNSRLPSLIESGFRAGRVDFSGRPKVAIALVSMGAWEPCPESEERSPPELLSFNKVLMSLIIVSECKNPVL